MKKSLSVAATVDQLLKAAAHSSAKTTPAVPATAQGDALRKMAAELKAAESITVDDATLYAVKTAMLNGEALLSNLPEFQNSSGSQKASELRKLAHEVRCQGIELENAARVKAAHMLKAQRGLMLLKAYLETP